MPRVFISVLWVIAGLSGAGTAAEAQEAGVKWHFMGGYSATIGSTSDYLQGGYLVGGGFSITPTATSPVDVRFDLTYSEHNATDALLNIGQQVANTPIDNGTGSFWSFSGNVVYHVPFAYGIRGYGIAGAGVYHERVELTQGSPYGYSYCDPFYGYCDAYGGSAVVASSGETKFGWNAGAGVEFALPYGRAWFVEARYHRISTHNPVEYVPIEVGYRF